MSTKKQTWIEKLHEYKHSSVRKMTDKGMMYISTPKEIDKLVKKIPKGKLTSTKKLTEKLSKKYDVDFTCPLTTGIFVSIVANAAKEERETGMKDITPYWRVVKGDGALYPKYLGEASDQKKLLKEEGYKFKEMKTKTRVIDFEEYLV